MPNIGGNYSKPGHVTLDDNVCIGDNGILVDNATIGDGIVIDYNHIVLRNTKIRRENQPFQYCITRINHQHTDLHSHTGRITIDDHTIILQFVAIHHSTIQPATIIDSYYRIMVHAHIVRECAIRDRTILAVRVVLDATVRMDKYASIGLGTHIHQSHHIGKYTMIGFDRPNTKDVLPFVFMNRQRFKINRISLGHRLEHGGWWVW